MSCPLVVVLLTLSAIALAMAQTTISNTASTTVTPTPKMPPSLRSCNALNKFDEAALMEAKTFVRNLDECTESNENKTLVADVLVELNKKIITTRNEIANLTAYPEIMRRISNCASKLTGLSFNESESRKQFGMPKTLTFKFGMLECKTSLELADCVESVYAGHLNATTKRHKNVYMRLFDGIAPYCQEAWIRENGNKGHHSAPSFTLIMGSVLMIFKLLL